MKNIFFSLQIVALFVIFSCGGTKQPVAQTATPQEQAVYEVLNFCLTSSEVAKGERVLADETVSYMPILSDVPNRDNRYFTKEDIAYMHQQENDSVPISIDPKKLSRPVKMASYKGLKQWLAESEKSGGLEHFWDKVYNEYGRGYGTFSKPLFSKDYKTAVIAFGNHCGGLCGHGATYILQKDENGWKVAEVFNNWIS